MLSKALERKLEKYCCLTAKEEFNGEKYYNSPIEFIEKIIVKKLTPEQKEIAESVAKNQITLAVAGHSVGKTSVSAWLVLWWVFCREGMAITTAPTNRQVKELLWREIGKAWRQIRDKVGGRKGQLFLESDSGGRALGFSIQKGAEGESDTFQGIHDENLLVIIDEANAKNLKGIWDGAMACCTGRDNRLLAIGNPTASGTDFHRHCLKKEAIKIAVWSHPNLEHYYHPVEVKIGQRESAIVYRLLPGLEDKIQELPQAIPGAVSPTWVEGIRQDYGEGSVFWKTRLDANFPDESDTSLCPEAWFERVIIQENLICESNGIAIGIDVADGCDEHAIAMINPTNEKERVLFNYYTLPTYGDGEDLNRLHDEIITIIKSFNYQTPITIGVDAIGVGVGVVGQLRKTIREEEELKDRIITVLGICWSEKSTKPKQYFSLKSEMHALLKEQIRTGSLKILSAKYQEKLRKQLNKIHFEIPEGEEPIKVEGRKHTVKRLGCSPDLAAAVIIAANLKINMGGQINLPNNKNDSVFDLFPEYEKSFRLVK